MPLGPINSTGWWHLDYLTSTVNWGPWDVGNPNQWERDIRPSGPTPGRLAQWVQVDDNDVGRLATHL